MPGAMWPASSRTAVTGRLRKGADTLRTTTRISIVSFRLGGPDGVSIEAQKWAGALTGLGLDVQTVAGGGIADVLVPGLDLDAPQPVDETALADALHDSDLVVVENACSLPLNLAASTALARQLRGRRTLLHHHDLPWQRRRLAHLSDRWPPDDPLWLHVTINRLSQQELAERHIASTVIYNAFPTEVPTGRREHARRLVGVGADERLVLQPTRAIARKNVPAGIALAEALGATYWLTGPAEEGYGPDLEAALSAARCPVRRGVPGDLDLHDAYAAADVVAFPSTWEGFGNPLIEAAVHRRPLAVGHYPVLNEVERYGFRWFRADRPDELHTWLEHPDEALLTHNQRLAEQHFSLRSLRDRLEQLLVQQGWDDLLAPCHELPDHPPTAQRKAALRRPEPVD